MGRSGREESWLEWRRRVCSRGQLRMAVTEENELPEKLRYVKSRKLEKKLHKTRV